MHSYKYIYYLQGRFISHIKHKYQIIKIIYTFIIKFQAIWKTELNLKIVILANILCKYIKVSLLNRIIQILSKSSFLRYVSRSSHSLLMLFQTYKHDRAPYTIGLIFRTTSIVYTCKQLILAYKSQTYQTIDKYRPI